MMNKIPELMLTALGEYWRHSPDMAFVKDIQGVYVGASNAFAAVTLYSDPAELVGKTDFEIFADAQLARRYVDDDARLLSGGVPLENYIEPFTSQEGRPRYCMTSKHILRDEGGEPCGILGFSRDITHEYRARQRYESELRRFLELPGDTLAAVLIDLNSWRVVDARWRDSLDHVVSQYVTVDAFFSNAAEAVVEDEQARALFRGLTRPSLLSRYEHGEREFCAEYLRRSPAGDERWVRAEGRYLLDPVNGRLSLLLLLQDIDESKRAYTELVRAAQWDTMTELLNRSTMMKAVQTYLCGEGLGKTHALFIIDLDNFKQINDSFGHQYGDGLLKDAADAIKGVFRASDLIARLGGDEFMVLMRDAGSEQVACRKASALISALQFSARDAHTALELTCSVGLTVFIAGQDEFDALYREADTALYRAKQRGKNCYCLFSATSPEQQAPVITAPRPSVDTVHLHTLLEYMDGGVILAEVDDDIRITYVSPSFFRSFGHSPQDLGEDGQGIFSFVLPADLPALRSAITEAAHKGELLNHSYRVYTKQGLQWRHIRVKRIPHSEGCVQRVVSVVTDVTPLKRSEEQLLAAEMRYRTAVEQMDVMLWEVDLNTRVLTLNGAGWSQRGYSQRRYPCAPETYLRESELREESAEQVRCMFADLYRGHEGTSYYFRIRIAGGEESWVKSQFRLLRDEKGAPAYALGMTTPVPNIDAQMRRFEQEMRFVELVRGCLRGYLCANFTQGLLVRAELGEDEQYASFAGMDYDEYHTLVCETFVDARDRHNVAAQTSREALLERFRGGESWILTDYRRMDSDGVSRWISVFVRLMRHPISGDVFAFAYLRDNDQRHRWELALGAPIQLNSTLMFYSQSTMAELSHFVLSVAPRDNLVSVSVIELLGFAQARGELGSLELGELLFTFGRLCRIAISGDVLIGQLDEGRIVLLRADAGSAELQHERSSGSMAILRRLLTQAYPQAKLNLIGGFSVAPVGDTNYDLLLRQATLACRSASRSLDEAAIPYADSGVSTPNEREVHDLAARYQALELRYQQLANLLRVSENDELTGLLGKRAFCRSVRELLDSMPSMRCCLVRFDLNRFKVYNDVRGTAAGDRLLRDIAAELHKNAGPALLSARLESDHFVLLAPDDPAAFTRSQERLAQWLAERSPDFCISFTVGVYRITDPSVDVSLMCDRALLALRGGKSAFESRLAYYDESLRGALLEEQRLMDDIELALLEEQFELYYQPQVNYEDGSLIGAEALVRWNHPTRGLLLPADFIPLFEQNGLITRLDRHIWDLCCRQMAAWARELPQASVLPISVNVSRLDIYDPQLCATLLRLTEKHGIPVSCLKLEITEGAYMENPQQLIDTVQQLQAAGFIVEMDDFGSGYSSLNTLKDVSVDILKLDMKFLASCTDSARGGNVLSSIIRMAHWLKLPVIAEGVETREQAEFLKSLSCVYMQGYYFSKPMPAERFEALLRTGTLTIADRYSHIDLEGVAAFWDSSAQTALLFNSFVGGAAILEYEKGVTSIIRANDRFYHELETTRADYLMVQQHTLEVFEEADHSRFRAMLDEAVRTGDEAECELRSASSRPGGRPFWTRNRVRTLARNGDVWLLYLAVENITDKKEREAEREAENERSRLLMESTGACLVDYDYASDCLSCQVYAPEQGIRRFTIPDCARDYLGSDVFTPESTRVLREALFGTDSGTELEFCAALFQPAPHWYRLRYIRITDDLGQLCQLIGQLVDIQPFKEREALSEALRQRLNAKSGEPAFNDVIVNQIFNLFYEASDIVSSIETTLALLGEYYELSCVYIFEDSADHLTLANSFAWRASTDEAKQRWGRVLSYDELGSRELYLSQFGENGIFYCTDIHTLAPELRTVLEGQGVHSLLQCELREGGVFSGVIGFDECRPNRSWSDEQIGTLLFVSRIIGAFLLKLRQWDSAAFSADFRAALDDNAAFVYLIDPQSFELIYSNRAILSSFGQDFIGQRCHRCFAGRDEPCAQCPALALRAGGSPVAEVPFADGRLMLAHVSPLRWNGREMLMLSCVDVTEGQRAQAELITEKQKTDLALAATNLTLWTYDLVADTLTLSGTVPERFPLGRTIHGSYKTPLAMGAIQPESEAAYAALHEALLAGAPTSSATIRFNTDYSPVEWMHITYTAIADASGATTAAIAIGEDVTALKLAESRYQQEAEYRKTLGADCVLTLRLNLNRNVIEDVQSAETLFHSLSGQTREQCLPFFYKLIPDAGDRERFLRFFEPGSLLDAYARGETELSLRFSALRHGGQRRFVTADVKLARRPSDGVIIAFVALRDQTAQRLVRSIIDKIVEKNYDYIAYIDVATKYFQLYACQPELRGTIPAEGPDFDAHSAEMVRRGVAEADAQRVLHETSLAYVTQRLAVQGEHLCVYRSTPQTGSRMRRLTFYAFDASCQQLMLTRQDVTELLAEERRNSERLAEALADAKKANAAKSEFLSKMSHDIRTPLNAIIGLTALALGGRELPEDTARHLCMIEDSGRFLQGLLSDILDTAKIEQGIVELHPGRYVYSDFLRTLKAVFLPLCGEKGLRFELSEPQVEFALTADRVRFEQIFFNVLSNALRFTPPGGVIRFAHENLCLDNGRLACDFVISDNGCGISADFLPQVFEPFAQEDRYGADEQGSGLGLSITKSLVDLMGGSVVIESVPGVGTTVRIHLDLPLDETPVPAAAPSYLCSARERLAGARILLAEDIPINTLIVRGLLERVGAEVVCTPNGLEALQRFTDAPPGWFDAILLDIAMPVMDGLEAARRLRALPRADAARIPIIALSANIFEQDRTLSRQAGMDAHLPKPLDAAGLFETLAQLIAERGGEDKARG